MGVVNVDRLLMEISRQAPSGERDLEYDPAFIALEERARGTPEVVMGKTVMTPAKPPDWKDVQMRALELLSRTHDLRVAVLLLRALLHNHGFQGLRHGLALIVGFVERYWDSFYPQLGPDDGYDPEYRINILTALEDYETVLFPLMNAPLFSSPSLGPFHLHHIYVAQGKIEASEEERKSAHDLSTIEAVLMDAKEDAVLSTLTAIRSSLKSIVALEALLTEKVAGGLVPSFPGLRKELTYIAQFMGRRSHPPVRTQGPPAEPPTAPPEKHPVQNRSIRGLPAMNQIHNRQDVIQVLQAVCSYYGANEPASPVPLLLKRAMRLVEKDFIEIIKDLTPGSMDQIRLISGVEKDPS